jgi:hypothetical protein
LAVQAKRSTDAGEGDVDAPTGGKRGGEFVIKKGNGTLFNRLFLGNVSSGERGGIVSVLRNVLVLVHGLSPPRRGSHMATPFSVNRVTAEHVSLARLMPSIADLAATRQLL